MVTSGTRILLVGDRTHLRAQVRLIVESHPGLVVVGEAGSCCEALTLAQAESPDFILVDGGTDAIGALDRIGDLYSAARHLLVMSDHMRGDKVVESIINLLDPEQKKIAMLTERELTVIRLVAKGYRNREIAERLLIGKSAVSRHLKTIFLKLEVQDRLELLIYSFLKGLASLYVAFLFLDDGTWDGICDSLGGFV